MTWLKVEYEGWDSTLTMTVALGGLSDNVTWCSPLSLLTVFPSLGLAYYVNRSISPVVPALLVVH